MSVPISIVTGFCARCGAVPVVSEICLACDGEGFKVDIDGAIYLCKQCDGAGKTRSCSKCNAKARLKEEHLQ